MKSKLLKLMCLLCVGMMSVSAWGANKTTTYTITSKAAVSEDANIPDGSTATFSQSYSTMCQMTNSNYMTLTLSGYDGMTIKSLSLSMKSNKSGGAGYMYMKIGETTVASIGSSSQGINFNTSPWYTAYSTSYVDIPISVTETTVGDDEVIEIYIKATVNSLYCQSFSITYDDSDSGGGSPTPSISFATSAVNLAVDGTYTQAASTTNTDDATVTYSSDDTEVATVNSSTGEVTGVAEGTATITASVTVDETEYTASYDVTVYEPVTFNAVTNMNQLVAGNEYIIVSSNSAMGGISTTSTTYGLTVAVTNTSNSVSINPTSDVVILTLGGVADAWTFQSSANDEYLAWSSGNSLTTLDGSTSDNAKWIVTDDFMLKNKADETRILKYNSGSPRFACYTSGQTSANLYVKAGSPVAKNVATVSIGAIALAIGGTATVSTNGPSVTLSTSDASVASVSGTTVTAEAAGSATITATWDEDENFQAGSKVFTVTVLHADGLSAADAFTVAEARAKIDDSFTSDASTVDYYVTGIISQITSYSSNQIIYWISDDGTTTDQFECYKGKSIGGANFTATTNLQLGATVVVKGKIKKYGSTYEFDSNNELVSLVYTRTTTADTWGTLCLPYAATVAGATLYTIDSKDAAVPTYVTLTPAASVEAGVPYIFKATGTELSATQTGTTYADAGSANGLNGTYTAIAASGFTESTVPNDDLYLMTATKMQAAKYATASVGANRAYILMDDVPVAAGAKGIRLYFDGTEEATAIAGLTEKTEVAEGVIYNLQGQQLSAPQRGINIVNGKKVLVK